MCDRLCPHSLKIERRRVVGSCKGSKASVDVFLAYSHVKKALPDIFFGLSHIKVVLDTGSYARIVGPCCVGGRIGASCNGSKASVDVFLAYSYVKKALPDIFFGLSHVKVVLDTGSYALIGLCCCVGGRTGISKFVEAITVVAFRIEAF